MNRNSNYRERDEYGRFISEDDDRGGRASGGRSYARHDDDDRRYSGDR